MGEAGEKGYVAITQFSTLSVCAQRRFGNSGRPLLSLKIGTVRPRTESAAILGLSSFLWLF